MARLAAIPPQSKHHAKRHAAARTDEYLYSQLIPYIGNKRKLLPLIAEGIAATGLRGGTFVDLFSGSTVVSRLAKTMGFWVVANDWEPYATTIAHATVALNRVPAFDSQGGAAKVFETLNALPPEPGYIAQHLCPADDEQPDPDHERMFFTRANGERIDTVRRQIARWEMDGALSPDERAYLLSALLYSVSYVSNTSGVFKGFHHGWGGRTGTALYRILSVLTLRPPVLFDNGFDNRVTRCDAHELAANLRECAPRADRTIVYIDPPYNQHPYGSNYHVLNTVTLADEPAVNVRVRVNGKKLNKSAIRTDWQTERRSSYNSARLAPAALEALVNTIDARWLMMSYSTDGNIPLREALQTLAARGRVQVLTRKYKRYRVSTPRMSAKPHNIEFLAVVDTQAPASLARVEAMAEAIEREERGFWRPKRPD